VLTIMLSGSIIRMNTTGVIPCSLEYRMVMDIFVSVSSTDFVRVFLSRIFGFEYCNTVLGLKGDVVFRPWSG